MEHEPIRQFTVGDLIVKIYQDDDPESPRTWGNLGTMVCWHSRYDLGEDTRKSKGGRQFPDPDSFREWWDEHGAGGVILPILTYEHGGITISTTGGGQFDCQFDGGQAGWIYATADTIRAEYNVKRITAATHAKVLKVLQSEVEVYDQYLRGDVYGYVIEDAQGNHIDSCWGFYGADDCESEARAAAEHAGAQLIGAGAGI